MISLDELTAHTNNLLDIQNFTDYCPNGLQIAGKQHIQKIVTGVTACQALIDAAIHAKADALLVHHGYFWRGEEPCLIGIKGQRIKTLLQHDISLIAYHLPNRPNDKVRPAWHSSRVRNAIVLLKKVRL